MRTPVSRLLAATALTLPLWAAAGPDPSDPAAPAPALSYRSALEGHARWRDTPPGDWRAANAGVAPGATPDPSGHAGHGSGPAAAGHGAHGQPGAPSDHRMHPMHPMHSMPPQQAPGPTGQGMKHPPQGHPPTGGKP